MQANEVVLPLIALGGGGNRQLLDICEGNQQFLRYKTQNEIVRYFCVVLATCVFVSRPKNCLIIFEGYSIKLY